MGKLHLHLPGRPKGDPVGVVGLGLFGNDEEHEIPGDEDIYIPGNLRPEAQEEKDQTPTPPPTPTEGDSSTAGGANAGEENR
jgi:hypothetical protein